MFLPYKNISECRGSQNSPDGGLGYKSEEVSISGYWNQDMILSRLPASNRGTTATLTVQRPVTRDIIVCDI